jgi:hypothetical protein
MSFCGPTFASSTPVRFRPIVSGEAQEKELSDLLESAGFQEIDPAIDGDPLEVEEYGSAIAVSQTMCICGSPLLRKRQPDCVQMLFTKMQKGNPRRSGYVEDGSKLPSECCWLLLLCQIGHLLVLEDWTQPSVGWQ